ncbi:CapA family protein [Mucilaginibacter sp. X5P1]|uniref:CapA family protein n=1 Tax=Mucilaginibacter sp. X5P1 TaxID=2723088 RepID=UPI001615EC9F|nr:CapA family protein [Mucilaginibacter sp. X5P1]MBB6140307.1 poly-gamma-glutamate capsule biosynthesis protein CapA/YwtB (metallophosphatase superfamily) [Mucilaginibacter sp. X5P1]
MKILRLLFVVYVILAFQSCIEQTTREPAYHTPKIIAKQITLKPVQHDTLCIAAVGDIMLGTSYPDDKTLPPDSAKESFTAVAKYLQGNDITFGNLEGTLLDTGGPVNYKMHQLIKAYLFRMPVHCGFVLKNAGFNLLSIANNHIDDFGNNGRVSTVKMLDSCGIHYAGLKTHPSTIFEVNGVKYGFCAFSPNSQTVSLLDLNGATQIIRQLKQHCDVVIVSFHGGGEGVEFEHVPLDKETYVGENRGNVYAFAHNAIDAGADLIFGNGPHVTRAMELYKNRLIAYSLGNFCTYKCVSVAGICGIAPLLKVHINKKGEFLNGRIIAIKQTHYNGLEPDTLNTIVKRVKLLTATDFPESGLSIGDDGVIIKAALDTAQ